MAAVAVVMRGSGGSDEQWEVDNNDGRTVKTPVKRASQRPELKRFQKQAKSVDLPNLIKQQVDIIRNSAKIALKHQKSTIF